VWLRNVKWTRTVCALPRLTADRISRRSAAATVRRIPSRAQVSRPLQSSNITPSPVLAFPPAVPSAPPPCPKAFFCRRPAGPGLAEHDSGGEGWWRERSSDRRRKNGTTRPILEWWRRTKRATARRPYITCRLAVSQSDGLPHIVRRRPASISRCVLVVRDK